MGKNVTAPAMFDGSLEIPFPALAIFEPVEQDHVMSPGQFCSKLQNLGVRPGLGEGTHVAQIPEAEALHAGKFRPEILGQTIHHLRPPPLRREPGGEILSNGPVELDGFLVQRQGSPQLGGANPGLQLFEQRGVARRERG
jgi:hypothetical protein